MLFLQERCTDDRVDRPCRMPSAVGAALTMSRSSSRNCRCRCLVRSAHGPRHSGRWTWRAAWSPATPVIARHPFDVAKPHWQQRLCAPQCVTPSLGLPYRVFRISCAIRSSSIIRGLPGRRPSLSPLIHFSRKLARHVPTVAFLRPKREATAGYSRGRTPEAFCNSGHLGCAGTGGGLVIICG